MAKRLSKDHKPTDEEEAKRVVDEGGVIGAGNRVNHVLAVSRALGDHTLKPVVSPEPYCTITKLSRSDWFVVIACDGVISLQFL
jgi:protein phosphatase PTC1